MVYCTYSGIHTEGVELDSMISLEVVPFLLFAVYYCAIAIPYSKGLFGVFEWLRSIEHPKTIGELFQCPVCVAFWAALVLWVWVYFSGDTRIVTVFGLAGGVVFLHRLTD